MDCDIKMGNKLPGLGQQPPITGQQPQQILQPAPTAPKKKVLVWSDCVAATTGFGIVSKHVLAALHATGRYEIDQLAINYFGDFFDVPYRLSPARLKDPKDPYGNQMLINSLQKGDYDILFVINDTFVVEKVAQHLREIRDVKRANGKKVFKVVYYYPVDCRFLPQAATMVKEADRAVAYTNFAAQSTKPVVPDKPTDIIYHGTDIAAFHPIVAEMKRKLRTQYLRVLSDETFVLINVNRNSIRKDLARTILAFSEFRKKVPNSVLYLHTKMQDGTGGIVVDLGVTLQELGLDVKKDVLFPNNYSVSGGFPVHVLNQLYNCADAFITTNLGEGWGLTTTEAMAAGVPVIAPDNTTAPEILGNGERGYVYPCREQVYVDNSGYRKAGHMEDILEQMMQCYQDWKDKKKRRKEIIKKARAFTERYSWDNVCKQWVTLFDSLQVETPENNKDLRGEAL